MGTVIVNIRSDISETTSIAWPLLKCKLPCLYNEICTTEAFFANNYTNVTPPIITVVTKIETIYFDLTMFPYLRHLSVNNTMMSPHWWRRSIIWYLVQIAPYIHHHGFAIRKITTSNKLILGTRKTYLNIPWHVLPSGFRKLLKPSSEFKSVEYVANLKTPTSMSRGFVGICYENLSVLFCVRLGELEH